MKLSLILRSRGWALALASAGSSFGSDLVSPDGNRMAYVVPIYDKQASAYSVVFERATDGTSTNMLGKVPGHRARVSWIGNDRVAVHEFTLPHHETNSNLEPIGSDLGVRFGPTRCSFWVIGLGRGPVSPNWNGGLAALAVGFGGPAAL